VDSESLETVVVKDVNVSQCSSKKVYLGYPGRVRLKKGWEYDIIFRTGSRIKGKLVRLLFIEVPGSETRFGLAVGKGLGGAVVRNRGRRKLKEAIRHLLPFIEKGYWFVLSLNTAGLNASPGELHREIYSMLSENGFIKESCRGKVCRWEIEA